MSGKGKVGLSGWFLLSFLLHAGLLILLLGRLQGDIFPESEVREEIFPVIYCTSLEPEATKEFLKHSPPAPYSVSRLPSVPAERTNGSPGKRVGSQTAKKNPGAASSITQESSPNITPGDNGETIYCPPPSSDSPVGKTEEILSDNTASFISASGETASEDVPLQPDAGQQPYFSEPVLLDRTEAVYPVTARQNEWDGTVVVRIEVNSNGIPGECRIIETSGHPVLDQAALDAAFRTRYRPAIQEGKPVACTVSLTYSFNLNSR